MTARQRIRYALSYLLGVAVMVWLALSAPTRLAPHSWRTIHAVARRQAVRAVRR